MPKADPRDTLPAPPQHRDGQTTPAKDARPSPKQPHERDESSASQQRAPDERMRQAHADVAEGRSDTSRAEATDDAYARNLRSEPQRAPGTPSTKRPKAR
jgi:hypothetical protein